MKPVLIVQNCEAEPAGTIPEYLEANSVPFRLLRSDRGESFPEPDTLHAVVNLGCPFSVADYDKYDFLRKLYTFVAAAIRSDVPYLGICFGGQLLARVLGAHVGANHAKEIGTFTVQLTDHGRRDELFEGFEAEFPAFQWHGDTFKVPFSTPLLVEGDLCRNQAFRRGKQAALQFHLETRTEDVSKWCEIYSHELAETQTNRDKVLAAFSDNYHTIRTLNFRLLDNFLRIADNPL